MKLELIDKINGFSETLRIKPSTLCAMILEDKIEEWVQQYAERVYKDVLR